MKKKNYRLLSLLLALPLFLVGCNGGGGSQQGGGGGSSGGGQSGSQSGTTQEPAVTGVTITDPSETTVLDGTRVSLKATVAGDEGVSQKVKWSSSNDAVATVTNGVVNFLKVAEQTKVTITAEAQADAKFKDTVEFTVEHSPFDLKNSRGNPDTSCYLDDGSFIIEDPQDIALVYADVHDTRWYVEATIQVDSFLESDPYPKIGIMASDREDGMWCYEQSHQFFYFVDTVAAAQSWTAMNVCPENDTLDNWNWGGLISAATASPAVKKGEAFKMGLMRDGNLFYQFYGPATALTLNVVGSFEYNSFGEDANYVWVGGWATGATISDPKCLVGEQIDTLYTVPEGLNLKFNKETVYLGDTYQIEVNAEGLWNRNKLTFTSSDETVATVDAKGLITAASDKTGTAEITVGLQGTELSAKFTITVSDDTTLHVVLDGEMNDAIWSALVKENSYLLKKNDQYYVKMYGAKNARGLYIFMDYVVAELARCNPNEWWTWENVEFRLADDSFAWSDQYWLSSMNGGSFVSVGTGQKAEQIFFKSLVKGEDELYHGAFEMFVPYGDDKVAQNQATYAKFGWAPRSGWQEGYNWGLNPANANTLQITANGFAHDGTTCHEGHVYGEWITDVAANCTNPGSAHRVCRWCGHVETKALDVDPDAHVYDYEHAVVTTTPDCMHTGIGTATCKICGGTKETVLPRDFTNHTDADYPTTHAYCHDCGIGSHLTNPEGDLFDHNHGGWDHKPEWFDCGVWAGDWVIQLAFHMEGCQDTAADAAPGDTCWRTVLPYVYKDGWEAPGDSGNRIGHCFRMDWWGWDDGAFTSAANNGSIPADFDWGINRQAFSNMDVELTVTKSGANVTLDWTWTCLATEGYYQGKTFEYHQGLTLNADYAEKVGFALTAEWTIFKVTKADLSRQQF